MRGHPEEGGEALLHTRRETSLRTHARGLHDSAPAQRNLAALGSQPYASRENKADVNCKLSPKALVASGLG